MRRGPTRVIPFVLLSGCAAFTDPDPTNLATYCTSDTGYRVHGTINPESADRMIALARAIDLRVYVRVSGAERAPIQQALDGGAHGLVLPQIEGLSHAMRGAGYAKYPGLGTRGMGTPRSQAYGDTPPGFVEAEDRSTRCLVMIETPGALREVEAIAALGTVDGLFMGPYDDPFRALEGELAKYALWSIQTGSSDAIADALALRLAAIEAAEVTFRVSHQIHGAIGFCDETTLSWVSRVSVPIRRLPFGLSATRAHLVRRVGGRGLTGLWS